jgi:hypothetical protein
MRYLIVSCAIVCFIFFIIADAEKYGKKKFRGCRTNLMYEFAVAGIPADYTQKNIALPLVIFPETVRDDTCCVSFTDTTECRTV